MNRSLKLGIGIVFLFQLIIAASFGLSHDEAYYWLFSKHLSFGYFDHPPFMAAVIALFSFLPHHELSVRIGFILLQAGTLFLLFRMIRPESRTIAFLMFFAFPLASYSGLLALPDMPLLFMTAAYFYFLRGFLHEDKTSVWMLALTVPLLLYAKYHGILLIFFTIVAVPRILLRRDFWLVTIISVILFAPHVWWQYDHDFPTIRYHFLERPRSEFSIRRILDYIGTQVALTGLFSGPLLWWMLARRKVTSDFERVLIVSAWGIFLFFLVSTFSKKVEANWTISLVVPFIILLSGDELWRTRWARTILSTSFAIVVLARLVFIFPSLPMKRVSEFHGWKVWSKEVEAKCGNKKIVANTYQIASKLSFYLDKEITALNYHSRKNQFDLWPREILGEVCYLTDKSEFSGSEVITPEGKKLILVDNLFGEDLITKKIEERSRETLKP